MKNLTLIGPPGGGKGTQANNLIHHYGLHHISTGDIFRAKIKEHDDLALKIKSYMDAGQLVPDEITIETFMDYIHKNPSSKGYVFDGFPRTENQIIAFESFLEKTFPGVPNTLIHLQVEENELITRLVERGKGSGRSDDTLATIKDRLKVFYNQTLPIIEYYKKKNQLKTIDGTGKNIMETWELVKACVE